MGCLSQFQISNTTKNKYARLLTGGGAGAMFLKFNDVLVPMNHQFSSGPETEESWKKRQDLCAQFNELLEKHAPGTDLPKDFIDNLKPVIGAISVTATSERTTLSSQACRVLGNLGKVLGSQIHPFLDIILPNLIAHCGSTKGVNQKNAHEAILTIVKYATFHGRLLYHVTATFSEKRNPPRIYAPIWLTEIIRSYGNYLDQYKDYATIDKAITAGLNDAQIKVREHTRATYWAYWILDNNHTFDIKESLNSHARIALNGDDHNPNKPYNIAKKIRQDSAMAIIRAQKKEQLQQKGSEQTEPDSKATNHKSSGQRAATRNITPMSITSVDFPVGPIEGLSVPDEANIALPKSNPKKDAWERMKAIEENLAKKYQAERAEEAKAAKIVKEQAAVTGKGKAKEAAETQEIKTSSDSRPLLSAPVRRPRIVATPMPQTQHGSRPTSRGEPTKAPIEIKDRHISERPTGRQTPISNEEGHTMALSTAQSKKTTSTQAEQKPNAASTTTQPRKKSPRRGQERPRSVQVLPVRHQKTPSASEAVGNPRLEPSHQRTASTPHVREGKENAEVARPLKSTPHRNEGLDKARRSLSVAIDALRTGRLDCLGYRKLKKLVTNYPKTLITSEQQFKDLYEPLIASMVSIEELTEPRELRNNNMNHPFYNRYNVVNTAMALLDQYPHYGEPVPGMTLVALIKARVTHSEGHTSAVATIENAAACLSFIAGRDQTYLPVIDAVADTLQEVERIILNHDRVITTPNTWERDFTKPAGADEKSLYPPHGLPSDASDFGPQRPNLPERLPIIMSFGLGILTTLISHTVNGPAKLFEIQEDRLASLARECLATYRSLIKRQVMIYCAALHMVIKPERRFYQYFESETDRNLIHYSIAGNTPAHLRGPLGKNKSGRLVEPSPSTIYSSSSWSGYSSVPLSFETDDSDNYRVLGTTAQSGNWDVLGTTGDE